MGLPAAPMGRSQIHQRSQSGVNLAAAAPEKARSKKVVACQIRKPVLHISGLLRGVWGDQSAAGAKANREGESTCRWRRQKHQVRPHLGRKGAKRNPASIPKRRWR